MLNTGLLPFFTPRGNCLPQRPTGVKTWITRAGFDTPIEDIECRRKRPITFEDYKRLVEKRIPMLTSRDNPERWLRSLWQCDLPNGFEAGAPWPDMVQFPQEPDR